MDRRGWALAVLAAWGAIRLMGPGGSATRQRMRGKAEELRGRLQQAMGDATGSKETRFRGELTEAKGMGREKVADVEETIDEIAGR